MPLTIDEALEKLRDLITPAQHQPDRVAVSCALNRVMAEDTYSPVAVPAFANSAMDGYAVRFSDLRPDQTLLNVQGESLAGHPYGEPLAAASAVRIFTGAALPPDSDTIVIQENTERLSKSSVQINGLSTPGAYVRDVGHDVAKDTLLLSKGRCLRAFELAAATTSGLTHVKVERRLRVGVFATGDELKTPGTALARAKSMNRIGLPSSACCRICH